MNNPTHFIEVFSGIKNVRGRTEQGICTKIKYITCCLTNTNNSCVLKTVAIFKIKMKNKIVKVIYE